MRRLLSVHHVCPPPRLRHQWRGSLRQFSGCTRTRQAATPPDFAFYPDFFSLDEQRVLLRAALQKLDSMETAKARRRRRQHLRDSPPTPRPPADLIQAVFLPDDLYEFQEGHFDGVIKRYREMHVTSWPEDVPQLPPLLNRFRRIHPDQHTQTHILHLASDGEILPHVDNVEASGTWILGVSLGDERTLRLENSTQRFDITLPSGSVYMQKDTVRYDYQHAILKKAVEHGAQSDGRQRLSIMIRDRVSSHSL